MGVAVKDRTRGGGLGPGESYPPKFKREVVAFAADNGIVKAAEHFRITKGSVRRWIRIQNRNSSASPASNLTTKAVGGLSPVGRVKSLLKSKAFNGLPRHEKKALLADELLKLTAEFIDRIRSPDVQMVATARGDVVAVTNERPAPRDVRELMTAAGIATDKSILLSGEATSRHEHVDVTALTDALNTAIADPRKRRELALLILQAQAKASALPRGAPASGTTVPRDKKNHAVVSPPRVRRMRASRV